MSPSVKHIPRKLRHPYEVWNPLIAAMYDEAETFEISPSGTTGPTYKCSAQFWAHPTKPYECSIIPTSPLVLSAA